MKLRTALIAAFLCTTAPAFAQTQPGTPAPNPPQHAPGQAGVKSASDKPVEKLDPAKEAAIRHLMDITESSKLGQNLSAAITAKVRDAMSRAIPQDQLPKFMDSFSQKFAVNAPASAVTDAMIPIYAKTFTMEEIQGLTKFYETPLGQHVVKALPQVSQESQIAGVQIDQPIAIETLRSMETEYPQLKQMLPPEPSAPPSDASPSAAPPNSTPPSTTPQSGAPPKMAPSAAPPQK